MRHKYILYLLSVTVSLFLWSNMLFAQNKPDTTKQQLLLFKDSADWKIGMMLLNTPEHEFSPVMFRNGLFFCTNAAAGGHARHNVNWNGLGFTHVLYIPNIYKMPEIDFSKHQYADVAIKANRTLDELHKTFFKKTLSDFSVSYHYGPLCFSADGQKVFFTRTQKMSAIMFEICEATVTADGKFENIKSLPFNSKNFNCYHPAITKDGNRLYFVCDKLGGIGKADIYYADRFGDTWSADPLNMGAPVNTAGNEMFPFIHNDTLYYSSDGMPDGLGGMDIYTVDLRQRTNRHPVNLGFPINSSKNDFGITGNNDGNNYFSSNRNGNDDIYKFSYNPIFFKVKGKTVNQMNKEPLAQLSLKQLLIDEEPKETFMDSLHTDTDGNYSFKIKPNHNYKFIVAGKNIFPDTLIFNTDYARADIVKGDWLLHVKVDSAALLSAQKKRADSLQALAANDSIGNDLFRNRLKGVPYFVAYFNYNSNQLLPSGFAAMDNLANKLKKYADQNVGVIINGYTDHAGSNEFNLNLSRRRAQMIAAFLRTKNIPDSLIHVQYFGKENPVIRDGKVIDWMSRRAEIELTKPFKTVKPSPFIIQPKVNNDKGVSSVNADSTVYTVVFDYKSDKISSDAFVILDKLIHLALTDTTSATVTIKFTGSSDSTESSNNDLTLAKRRVDVVLQYIRSRNLNVIQPEIHYQDKLQPKLVNGQLFSWMNRKVEIVVNRKK